MLFILLCSHLDSYSCARLSPYDQKTEPPTHSLSWFAPCDLGEVQTASVERSALVLPHHAAVCVHYLTLFSFEVHNPLLHTLT